MDDPTHIAAILAALANGDDPFTGLPLPEGHALADVRVKAALAAAAARIDPELRLDQVSWREPGAELDEGRGLLTVTSPKGDARFLDHFERGHLLTRCVDEATIARARRLLTVADPTTAEVRLAAALSTYAARGADAEG